MNADDSPAVSSTKLTFIVTAFVVLLTAFVLQTEFTSQVYKDGFSEPIVLLWVTHGLWWLLWPIQTILAGLYRTFQKWRAAKSPILITSLATLPLGASYERVPLQDPHGDSIVTEVQTHPPSYWAYFKKAIIKQLHNVYHTSVLIYDLAHHGPSDVSIPQIIESNEKLPHLNLVNECIKAMLLTLSIRYICKQALVITVILTFAGCTWYASMALTFASDVTAIYNCLAFTAYAFAIPMLGERFSWLKVLSVIVAIAGVFVVSYSSPSDDVETDYPYRLWGNLLILFGAALYGFYECLYKKWCCIPNHLASEILPRRQLSFANFIMFLFGIFTFVILLVVMFILEVTGIHHFKFNYGDKNGEIWSLVGGSIVSNLLFSGSFLLLMALTLPVLSSVSSLLTIFLIGIVEWWMFGNVLSPQQLLGDLLIIIGFLFLTAALWKEISEGNDGKDDVDLVLTYSFAVSTEE